MLRYSIMTTINDLTIDDFQYIFGHLSYSDFINLSLASKYLQNIVKLYLNSDLKRKIVLQCGPSSNLCYGPKIISINFKSILRFIRIFGDQIEIIIFWVIDRKNVNCWLCIWVDIVGL